MNIFMKCRAWIFAGVIVIGGAFFGYRVIRQHYSFEKKFLKIFEEINIEKIIQDDSPQEKTSPVSVRVPIFVYHSVSPYYPKETSYQKAFDTTPQLLEAELKYLQDNHYVAISLDDLAYYFYIQKPLPQKPVILTFDDGWQSQYVYAFPLLKKYHDTATFFVYTGVIGYGNFFSWKELEEISRAGMSIGAHTKTHPYLVSIKDKNILKDEIIGSKKILEDHLQKPITAFAYPFGHYNDTILEIVKEAGFRTARSTYKGVNHESKDRYTLRSILVSEDFKQFVDALKK